MNTYSILTVLCVLVIFSYFFDLFARKTNVPSVLLLLGLGVGLRFVSNELEIPVMDFTAVLPILGTVGLILIVLEGALELKYEKGKSVLIRNAFGASFFILLVTAFAIAGLFVYLTGQSFYLCLLNAIPYSVISSAIAIPSVSGLVARKKEFIIYESSFSDILGIMIFNFVILNSSVTGYSFLLLGWELVLIGLLSLGFCFGLLFIMGRMKHQVKFFLIIASVILIYSVGKNYHLSSLSIVLVFGLFLENIELILTWLNNRKLFKGIRGIFHYEQIENDLTQLKLFSRESAFLLRTFFFLVFGYTLDVSSVLDKEIVRSGFYLLVTIYVLRFIYMRVMNKKHLWPEILVSPRGLISVLLFLQIPGEMLIFEQSEGLLVFMIITSSLLMSIALIATKGKREIPEE
jgi:hypothetical protein